MRVADDQGSILDKGDVGVLEVRGPNVFKGYWQMPEKTAEEFRDDGFFITGDISRIDEDGYIHIVGRAKDMIISGGFNVYPKEIEAVIDEVEGVGESAVIGLPHPDFGEAVAAVATGDGGSTKKRLLLLARPSSPASRCQKRCSSSMSCRGTAWARFRKISCASAMPGPFGARADSSSDFDERIAGRLCYQRAQPLRTWADRHDLGTFARPAPRGETPPRLRSGKFSFATTAELDEVDGLIGQERAVEAIRFGTEIQRKGFNLFVLGSPGLGKHTAVSRHLEAKAAGEPRPSDWVYVNNFEVSHKPLAIELPSGRGSVLQKGMTAAIDRLKGAIPALFESDDYRNRRRAIDESMQGSHTKAIEALGEKAKAAGVALVQSQQGLGMAPIKDGEVMPPDAFNALPDEEKKRIQETIGELQKELAVIMENLPKLNQERRDKIRDYNKELAAVAVNQALRDVKQAFYGTEPVQAYLESVRKDLIDHIEMFVPSGAPEAPPAPGAPAGCDDRGGGRGPLPALSGQHHRRRRSRCGTRR